MNIASLILTVDYELFGNGTGSLCSCILKPAERMISICNSYNMSLTIFVDVTEIIAIEAMRNDTQSIDCIKKQLISAVEHGHDVQLHIHPQWHNAAQREGKLDLNKWRIGDLDEQTIYKLLADGKSWLEDLLKPISPGYRCHVFRAGGWCIQPSELVISNLTSLGIDIDSTVAPGMREKSERQWYDFVSTPNKAYWQVHNDVLSECPSGRLLEIPIVTGKISPLRHLKALRNSKKCNNGLAQHCEGNYLLPGDKAGGLYKKLQKLSNLGKVMLDFSTMPSDILIDVTEQWIFRHSGSHVLPIVAISHTKNFTKQSEIALYEYCSWASSKGIYSSTYSDFLETL